MELGLCPRCATPYTASEVVGFGILRPRTETSGGPRVEYACQACSRQIQLIPYGEGRYAPPGQPPPAHVPEEHRRPPWLDKVPPRDEPAPPPPARDATAPPQEGPAEAPPEGPAGAPTDAESVAQEGPLGPVEALQILGLEPAADGRAIDRAFRERSLTCHPDKVAHMDLEFQELAERKFKRLQKAYDLLRS